MNCLRYHGYLMLTVVLATVLYATTAFAATDPVINRGLLMETGDSLPQGGVTITTVDLVSLSLSVGAFDWMDISVDGGYALLGWGAGGGLKVRPLNFESFKASILVNYHYLGPIGGNDDPYHYLEMGLAMTIGSDRLALHLGFDVGKSLSDFSGATVLRPKACFDAEIVTSWKILAELQPFINVGAPDSRKDGYLGLISMLGARYYGERWALDFGLGMYHDSDERSAAEKDHPLDTWSVIPFPWLAFTYRFGATKEGEQIEQPDFEESDFY